MTMCFNIFGSIGTASGFVELVRRIFDAEVLELRDRLALTQAGLELRVPRPRGDLTWAVLELTIAADGRRLLALLGPCEKQPGG